MSERRKLRRAGPMWTLGAVLIWTAPVFSADRPPVGAGADTVRVAGIAVEGHRTFSTRQILDWIDIRPQTRVTRAEVRNRLTNLLARYRDSGYPRAEARTFWEPASGGRMDLRVQVEEGPRYRVRSVSLEGCRGVPCKILESMLETREGSLLRSDVVRGDLEGMLEAYENRGYPYARIETRPGWETSGEIDLALKIDEGPRVLLEAIRIDGNTSTRDHVIERECGIHPGEIYAQKKIDRIRARLQRLGFFSDVTASVALEDESGRAALDIRVVERKTNSLYGAVGYVPREPEGYLTGILDLSFGNIGGTGRSAAVRWRTYQPGAFEWTFSYGEPWILGIPLEGRISVHQEVRDSTFTKTVGEVGLEVPLGDRFRASVGVRSEGVTAGSGGERLILGSRKQAADLAFTSDVRDDPLNPTRGWRGRMEAAYGRKQYDGGHDAIRSVVYEAMTEFFVPVARRQVLALMGGGAWLDTSERDVPEHEQFYVGGAESLRGYGEDAFFGWRVFSAGIEYRFLLGRRSRLHVFADGARLDRRLPASGGLEDRKTWLLGYGFGLRSESRLGMIGVDFGLARGDPLTEGKIHLRVEGEF